MDLNEEYEIFERLPGGVSTWRGLVRGLQTARVTVWLLSDETGHECFARTCTTGQIALARTPLRGARRIFQVAYGSALADRAQVLRREGYDVTSASGNRAAYAVLASRAAYDLFVLGAMASRPVRSEMARCVREHYPGASIIALNLPQGPALDELRFNAPIEPVTAWLPLISARFA